MVKSQIFIAEDEKELSDLICNVLVNNDYGVKSFNNGIQLIQSLMIEKPDLILLDLMLPGMNGLDVCREIKANKNLWDIPLIFLTAKNHEIDILQGFEVGADDYVTKPFNERILLARIKSALNREARKNKNSLVIEIDELKIDPERHEVTINNKLISLTFSEFRVLQFLAMKPGYVFSRYQIVEAIKGEDYSVNDRSIDVLLGRLRKKLGSYSNYIETIYGVGYRFID